MLYNAHNGSVRVENSEMDYVSFGNGNKNLIMLPGLGNGLSTVKGMAKDHAEAMTALGISKADVLGISQSGMIAQYLAIDYPDLVNKLILAVTSANSNEIIKRIADAWIEMAEQGNYKDLMIDTAEKSYSEKYLKKYRRIYPFIGKIGKTKSFKRFLIQAASCISHNAYEELSSIVCPTLVIGGDCDKIVGTTAAPAIAYNNYAKKRTFLFPYLW